MKPVVLGIAGGTGSGKTTVARAIVDRIGADRVAVESRCLAKAPGRRGVWAGRVCARGRGQRPTGLVRILIRSQRQHQRLVARGVAGAERTAVQQGQLPRGHRLGRREGEDVECGRCL